MDAEHHRLAEQGMGQDKHLRAVFVRACFLCRQSGNLPVRRLQNVLVNFVVNGRRTDDFVDHQPGLHVGNFVAAQKIEETADDGFDVFPGIVRGRCPVSRHRQQVLSDGVNHFVDHRLVQFLFGTEIIADGAQVYACLPGQFAGGNAFRAAAGKQSGGGF